MWILKQCRLVCLNKSHVEVSGVISDQASKYSPVFFPTSATCFIEPAKLLLNIVSRCFSYLK